ncbi:MAP3K epsilon protein kinase 1 [Datura stramonium]|uniref:MAP3K epsilon protein kinase 1 n=1 Tax=Datura stramonium TaxID=4076 RepID=A0ABS8SCD3_DATST|nr:MAP3K epsilon protein kinase 1 [Datura stramonium]
MESESGPPNGGDLLSIMMGVLKEDVIDMDGLAVEFSKLVSTLRTDEPEDVIVSACQKLIAFFHQRPDQKLVFVTQHGLLPLMELLEVMCSVLQVLNLIVQDNTDSQENACLVGFRSS